ncbi:chemotaxis protein CheB [Streptomyces sp. NPDC050147]|uniref:chemotaxis protein CheB n=1 Tax=Streptomyces sp. NPDC050147 TaxID=3155513 RepID=UPI003421F4EA
MPSEQHAPEGYAVVAIAASAGGVQALIRLLGGFDADLPVPVLLVQHLDPRHRTALPQVLTHRTKLTIKLAEDRDRIQPGIVYLAPPGRHLLVKSNGTMVLSDSEVVHFVRPSADLLFESVAEAYGPRAIACVLTGTGVDGARGVAAIKAHGGTVLVEDPKTAQFAGMPTAAVKSGAADHVLPLEEIAAALRGLVESKRQ